MKTVKYILTGCVAVLLLASCSKKYLDEVKPADGSLTNDIVLSTKIGIDNALTGIYGIMQVYAPSTARQNMYGIKTIQFTFDMHGNDLIADPANWWLYENNWTDNAYGRIATSERNKQIWTLYYRIINNANAIIEATPSIPEPDSVKAVLLGEARALRAFAYFDLARIYQFTYAKDPNAPGIPVYTKTATANSNGSPKSSLKDVYALVVSDLEFATANMKAARVDKYRINKNVAQGILARVYQELAMADNTLWAKALSNAQAATTSFPLMGKSAYQSGFNAVVNDEWMWGIQFNASQSLSYASFFGYIDPTSDNTRYKCIYVNSTFVSLFSATDARNVFAPAPGQSSANPWKKWQTYKFIDNANYSGDFVMMRGAEMYLIQAEALAQNNQLELAKDKLYELQLARDPNATRSVAADKATLINEILVERRKELYGEIGVEYFDLKRYQRPLVRDGIQWSMLNISANDNKWRWQIPQSELDANKALTAADQNPL